MGSVTKILFLFLIICMLCTYVFATVVIIDEKDILAQLHNRANILEQQIATLQTDKFNAERKRADLESAVEQQSGLKHLQEQSEQQRREQEQAEQERIRQEQLRQERLRLLEEARQEAARQAEAQRRLALITRAS